MRQFGVALNLASLLFYCHFEHCLFLRADAFYDISIRLFCYFCLYSLLGLHFLLFSCEAEKHHIGVVYYYRSLLMDL